MTTEKKEDGTLYSHAEFISLRLKPGDELISGIRRVLKDTDVKAGCITAAVGSLSKICLRFAGRSEITVIDGSFETVSLSGTIDAEGEHLHMTVSDESGRVTGGHVMPGCIVRTTMELVIGVFTDVVFLRRHCELSTYDELVILKKTIKK